jgi:hypothetical protein
VSAIKFVGWDKKPRTVLRSIKPGDIFAFVRRSGGFCFGRVMTKVSIGIVAEIFDFSSTEPIISEEQLSHARRIWGPDCLDSYSLFDRKSEGEWRIIGHQHGYAPSEKDNAFFFYGSPGSYTQTDIFDDSTPIDDARRRELPPYSPNGDIDVQEELDELHFP